MSELDKQLSNISLTLDWIEDQIENLSKRKSITDKLSQNSLLCLEKKIKVERKLLNPFGV